jgi:hypothetical protein
MLKTRLAPFVISSALVLGSLGAAANSSETQHAVDEQNFEFEETIDRELELFRGRKYPYSRQYCLPRDYTPAREL